MKDEIIKFNKLIENKSIAKIVIRGFSLFHTKEIEILLLTDVDEIAMRFNCATHFCGDLHIW